LYGWDVTFADGGDWTVTMVVEDGVWNVRVYTIIFHVIGIDVTPPQPNPFNVSGNSHYMDDIGER
jgi:hypothetical protein